MFAKNPKSVNQILISLSSKGVAKLNEEYQERSESRQPPRRKKKKKRFNPFVLLFKFIAFIAMIGIMMESIVAQKATAEDCRYFATHMARTLHTTHEDTAERLRPFGVTPAFDGMKIEI